MTALQPPYGHWPSAWSAAQAAVSSGDFAELCANDSGLFWLAFDPTEGISSLWHWHDGHAQRLTAAGVGVRSRVYEYGGGAFCVAAERVIFVRENDQQLWQFSFQEGQRTEPTPLTQRPDCRYGDVQFDAQRNAILAIEEQHDAGRVIHRIVSVALSEGARQVWVEGADFYSAPRLSPDGKTLAWIEWDRPHQAWTHTRLCKGSLENKALSAISVLAGQSQPEALQQPYFDAEGRLFCLTDRAGAWQPWCFSAEIAQPMAVPCVDHAPAPWQLGLSSYCALPQQAWALSRTVDGWGYLIVRDARGYERRLARQFSRFRQVVAWGENLYAIAAAPDSLPAVIAIHHADGQVSVVAGGGCPLPPEELARPQTLHFSTPLHAPTERAQAFFYPPRNARVPLSCHHEAPPLVIFLHGGPTSACYPVFDARIQFWTQRGFAVADVNYRGSSGFGRAYRLKLQGAWGVVEVEDARALVHFLACSTHINPKAVFIRGASAGGYTALNALIDDATFSAAASLYGVSDPLALRAHTHKFEGDYVDWLLGDPTSHADRYRARSPVHQAARIRTPVIFFQGGLDAVVVPEQTLSMVAALRAQGIKTECHIYAEERHGFRRADNLADALAREYAFYQLHL